MTKSTPSIPFREMDVHKARSKDGTEITARFFGQGPPLLLLPAGPGDSETSWHRVAAFLSEQFTCYLLNTRGRALSGDDPDHSPDRLVEDVAAFADSIGEPVGMLGWGSALWARAAASKKIDLFAVAVYEPGAGEVMSETAGKRMGEVFAGVGKHVAEGELVKAAREFIDGSSVIYSQEDLDSGAPAQFWEAAADRLPLFLRESKQASGSGGPGATSPETLGKITVPVLLLHGDRSSEWFNNSVQYVAGHLPDATERQIKNAAHFGPYTQPGAVADEMIRFFTEMQDQSR
jgi:pimeloyl-ACP methyl ester carboxylesterase